MHCLKTGSSCRIGKQLQSELRGCSLHSTDTMDRVSKGIAALVFDVCGVLKHFDQVPHVLRAVTAPSAPVNVT